jgi:hypothetical protein
MIELNEIDSKKGKLEEFKSYINLFVNFGRIK